MEKKLFLHLVSGALLWTTIFVIALAHLNPAMAATITVTNTNDSGAGSLREATTSASPGDTINFDVTGTITLTTGELLISKDLTIAGPGADRLAISGNNASRVFKITAGTVSISGATIQNANPPANQSGGGILNWGILTLNNVVVKNNTVNSTDTGYATGGGICNGCGPGMGTLTIINSTIAGNTADGGGGIFITPDATLSLIDSTISENSARGGGGILIYGTATLTNVTVSSNTVSYSGAAISSYGSSILSLINSTISSNTGGYQVAIDNASGSVTLRNTIVANHPSANCAGTITSNGYNLSSDNSCGFTGTGDLNNTDPLLGPLQNNDGPTFTHALLAGSPAIDAADPNNFPATDQRGVTRPQGAGPDIGAYEWTPVNPDEGTIGTVITISGSGFGTRKGKVVVGGASLKILDWTVDSIQCVLSRPLQPDTYDVTIQPQAKGSIPIRIPNGFTAKAPEIDSVEPAIGSVGDKITINGYYFGTKKGKVSLNGKSCRVLSWSMDPATGGSHIQFVVPRGLSPGTYELEVTVTGVGSDTVNFTVD